MTSLSLLLIAAGVAIIGLVLFLELKKRSTKKAERRWMNKDYQHEDTVLGEVGEAYDDGIIGEVRVVKSADEADYDLPESIPNASPTPTASPKEPVHGSLRESLHEPLDNDSYDVPATETVETPIAEATETVTMETPAESPLLSDTDTVQQELEFETEEVQVAEPEEASPPSAHETMMALTVMAQNDDAFEGADLLREFTAQNLVLGNDGFYHRPMPGLPQIHLFSVANVMQPGTLKMEEIRDLTTKGLLLFMHLPNKLTPVQAFEQFYDAADGLAVTLGGKVCDQQRNVLGEYRLEQMRDEMRHLEMKLEVEAKQNQR